MEMQGCASLEKETKNRRFFIFQTANNKDEQKREKHKKQMCMRKVVKKYKTHSTIFHKQCYGDESKQQKNKNSKI